MPVSVDRAATHLDLGELYVAHRLSLMRLAALLVDDRASAEDVVQDVFAGLASKGGSLRDPDKALAYLRKAVVNRSRSALRRRRTARGYSPLRSVEAAGPDERALLAEEHREILAALDRLAPRQREVLLLRYWSDLSEGEIADALGISRGSVKSTASRAMAHLETIMESTQA